MPGGDSTPVFGGSGRLLTSRARTKAGYEQSETHSACPALSWQPESA